MSKCIGQMYMFLCGIMIDYELFMEILYRCFLCVLVYFMRSLGALLVIV